MRLEQLGLPRWLVSMWPAGASTNGGRRLQTNDVEYSSRDRPYRGPQAIRQSVVGSDSRNRFPFEPDVQSTDDSSLEPTAPCDLQATAAPAAYSPIHGIHRLQPTQEGDLEWQSAKRIYRDIWQRGPGRAGGDWEDAEPGYRYGFERATEERLRGHSWTQVEGELAYGFAEWAELHGYDACWTTWASVREYVQDVWEELAGPLRITRLRRRAS